MDAEDGQAALEASLRALTEIIAAENAALRQGDTLAAASLLQAKQQAARALGSGGQKAVPAIDPELLRRLQEEASANEILLTRAMRVQSRILEMVTNAARRATPAATFYRPDGRAGRRSRSVTGGLRA